MSTQELYSKGTQVWMPSEEAVWQLGRLVDAYVPGQTTTLDVRLESDGTVKTVKIAEETDLPPLRNPEIFRGRSDLTQLSYLHEPAVLHNLRVRFVEYQSIYTYCGIVLVAINPYNELPIYDQSTMETYRGCAMGELDPHIFAIAEEAYTKMEREDKDQAIIVSGESGAGKTVSAKFAMRYFAAVNGSTTETNVERRVLATNPIMEAIGNAKTTRNDNSSRFGKFIEIDFDKQFNIIGAKMRTYLLEKSRVVFQSIEERNYHIFYQLCAAAKERPRDFTEMKLGSPDSFRYTSHGQNPVIPGVDDFEAFEETCQALDLLSFPQQEQHMMFCILAGILHLGDIKFQALDQDSSTVLPDDEHLMVFARLLGINASQLSIWLTKRKLVSAKEEMIKPMKLEEAEAGRDAFAKHIYARLFNWVVGHVNRKLAPDRNPHHFIGVLDIYGFETFEKNSFEQFCINYANEKLQQQFVIHVFKLEQEEYIREGIEWTMIDYFDNQPCIDLIEGHLGILDLLDEECRMPRGSDRTWNQKMLNAALEKQKKAEKTWKYFNTPRFGSETFIIVHFADKVEYSCEGFLDKNRDTMNDEFVNLLRASDYPLVAQLFHDNAETLTAGKSPDKNDRKTASTPTKQSGSTGGASRGTHKSHTQSVGSQFQDSLKALMDTLNATTPHYVRCIKPNDDKAAFKFDPKRAIQQLRACGVLETIRISAAGYPSRWSYREFFVRYRVMCRSSEVSRTDVRKTVETIVRNLIKDTDKYKLGKTMVFFRAGQVAYMEKLRNERRMALGLLIQKSVRAWVQRKKYLQLKKSVIRIQAVSRAYLARKHFQHLRKTAAATKIQASFRGFQQRKRFQSIQKSVVALQALARGQAARRRHFAQVRHHKAIVIQKHVRGWLARKRYARILHKIVYLQSCWRRWKARKELKALKIQARDVDHIKSLNKGLENKIIELQHKLNEQNVELAHKRKLEEEVKDLRVKAALVRQLESEVQHKQAQVALLEQNMMAYQSQLSNEHKKTEGLSNDLFILRAQVIAKDNTIREMTSKHSEEVVSWHKEKETLQQAAVSQNGVANSQLQERIEGLQKELADEREGRQRTVDDLDRYKQRHANLENQMKMEGRQTRSHHQRSPSDASSESDVSLATASTAFVPEIGDDGYSTQRSRRAGDSRRGTSAANANWGFESPKLGDGIADEMILEYQNGMEEVSIDEVQSLRNEVQHLRHQLDMRPELGEIVSERIRRLIEVNLSLRECLAQCQRALTGEVDPDTLTKLLYTLQGLLENSFSGEKEPASNMPNVMVEDVSGLDGASLNQLFLSLREALSIQASETEQFMDKNVMLSQKYTALMTENHHLKELLKRLSNSDAKNGVQTSQLMAEITQAMSHNGVLAQENQELRKRMRKLEKKLTLSHATGLNGIYGQNGYSGEGEEMPQVTMKSTQQGMIEFQQNSETTKRLADCLVSVSPQVASTLVLPGLPAYILFMAVRYTDHVNNEKTVKELLSTTKINIQNVLKKKSSGIEHFTLWLLNGLRLVDLLKQYSGDNKTFQKENSPKQNQHCLKNFDLSAFRTHFDDLCLSIYRSLVTLMQREIKDDAAKAIIEHESVLGLKEPGTLARRWKTKSPADCAASVQKKLEYYYRLITQDHALDPVVVRQIFRQLLFCLSANSVNFLMQSAKTCTFISGVQIRANISVLHEFVRSHSTTLPPEEMMQAMAAITECAHILQARKQKDEDIEGIVNMAKALSNAQIYKLLQNYTPTEEYDKVDPTFVQKMQARLLDRPEAVAPGLMAPSSVSGAASSVSMNTDYVYPVVFPYSPSRVELDSIQIPAALGLDFVRKI